MRRSAALRCGCAATIRVSATMSGHRRAAHPGPSMLRGAPVSANGMSAGLADLDPARHVDLLEIELEQWIVRDRFDHPPDTGLCDDGTDRAAERLVGGDLPGVGTDAQ